MVAVDLDSILFYDVYVKPDFLNELVPGLFCRWLTGAQSWVPGGTL